MAEDQIRIDEYDPFSQDVMGNPLPYYKELRRERPVFYSEKYDGYFFSRYDDIIELLNHVDNSFMASEGTLPTPDVLTKHNTAAPPILPTDPFPLSQRLGMPIHGDVRRAHILPMMPRSVKALREFVRDRANERIDVLLPQGTFDLTREYGGIISSSVIMHLMGMPLELAGEALDLVNAGSLVNPETGGVDTGAAAKKVIEFYLPWVRKRMEQGADGSVPMVDGMINYRFEGKTLSPEQVAQQLGCAFIGGIESVPKVTAHGLMELNARPEQMAQVRANLNDNVPKAAEEMIRYCAPAQWFMRTAHQPVTVAGQKIEPGQRAFYIVASALRDESRFDDPDEFQWNRDIRHTLAFGHGMHLCIGLNLARMEVRVLVDTFLRRVPSFRFDLGASVRLPSSFQWGWNSLVVSVD